MNGTTRHERKRTDRWRGTHLATIAATMAALPWVHACQPARPTAAPSIESRHASERIAAIVAAARANERARIPLLVDRLDDEDAAVRFAAILALEKITGTRRGYGYGDPPTTRSSAVQRWRRWVNESHVVIAQQAAADAPR